MIVVPQTVLLTLPHLLHTNPTADAVVAPLHATISHTHYHHHHYHHHHRFTVSQTTESTCITYQHSLALVTVFPAIFYHLKGCIHHSVSIKIHLMLAHMWVLSWHVMYCHDSVVLMQWWWWCTSILTAQGMAPNQQCNSVSQVIWLGLMHDDDNCCGIVTVMQGCNDDGVNCG